MTTNNYNEKNKTYEVGQTTGLLVTDRSRIALTLHDTEWGAVRNTIGTRANYYLGRPAGAAHHASVVAGALYLYWVVERSVHSLDRTSKEDKKMTAEVKWREGKRYISITGLIEQWDAVKLMLGRVMRFNSICHRSERMSAMHLLLIHGVYREIAGEDSPHFLAMQVVVSTGRPNTGEGNKRVGTVKGEKLGKIAYPAELPPQLPGEERHLAVSWEGNGTLSSQTIKDRLNQYGSVR